MMTGYVAFLRAINVGGRSMVKMDALKKAFDEAGCHDARTYIQSGNVVFECEASRAPSVFRNIHARVRPLLGREATILFRTLDELRRLVRANPFKAVPSGRDKKLYVTFLVEAPSKKPKASLASAQEALGVVGMKGLDVFVVSGRKKSGFYGFPNNFIEKELGVLGTSRNWSTVSKIVDFARTGPESSESVKPSV